MNPDDADLTNPPSDIELAQLLNAVRATLGPSSALVLRRLAFERDRLRGKVHDCPACGEACRQCRCVEAERERLHAALRPFAAYAAFLDDETSLSAGDDAPLDRWCPHNVSPTVGHCRAAREAIGG